MNHDIRGSEPGMTTKEMIGHIYDWAITEKNAELPRRMTEMEKWQNRVVGAVGIILALNLLDRVAAFVAPGISAAMTALR